MKTIEVRGAGLQTTVQDLGRPGFGRVGVSPSGAADPLSLRLGNRLVGNRQDAAGLEMTLLGGEYLFPEGGVAAITGSDFGVEIEGEAIELGASFEIPPGKTLRVGPTRSGARCYLCVEGGIEVPAFLKSASTQILSGLGGFEGRPLHQGDLLRVGPNGAGYRKRTIQKQFMERLARRDVLRVTTGPQQDWFSAATRRTFYSNTYRVGEQANRMGLRLEGASILGPANGAMITEGASLGAIQVPPGGQPIILFVEQQTTGGYPKMANVISADVHRVGQLRPRDEIRFERVSFEVARALLIAQEELLQSAEIIVE
jgi:biotin-dependent carboxylase-like uncharacterized protein